MSELAGIEPPPLARAWYVAGRVSDRGWPRSARVCGLPLVLFPSAGGWVALVDRCPHRGAPLSAGRMRGAALECPYHGWRFGAEGACMGIPASTRPAPGGRAHAAESRPVQESQGFLWVCPDPEPPLEAPPRFPRLGAPGYTTLVHGAEMPAGLVSTAENILDVPHTAFLHGGWFRGAPSRAVRAAVSRDAHGVQARFHGEPAPGGLLGRLLAPGAKTVEHVDRFRLPALAEVEYGLGDSHLVITSALTPMDAACTRVTAVASLRLPGRSGVLAHLAGPLARRVLKQDARMLRAITDNDARFDRPKRVSTEVDLVGPHIARLLRDGHRGVETPPFEREIELLV